MYLKREGWKINHKRLYRLYVEEGLGIRRRRPKRRRSAARRVEQPRPQAPNETWAMDFMHDALGDGRSLRVPTVVDVHTREYVVLEAGRSISGADVGRHLEKAGRERGGLPRRIRVDNGTEFTSKALDAWAYSSSVRPGCPARIRTEVPDSEGEVPGSSLKRRRASSDAKARDTEVLADLRDEEVVYLAVPWDSGSLLLPPVDEDRVRATLAEELAAVCQATLKLTPLRQ